MMRAIVSVSWWYKASYTCSVPNEKSKLCQNATYYTCLSIQLVTKLGLYMKLLANGRFTLAPYFTYTEYEITTSCASHLQLIIAVEMACFVGSLDSSPVLLYSCLRLVYPSNLQCNVLWIY